MKDGLIVYVVGDPELPEDFQINQAAQTLGHQAQQVELVSRNQGFFSVEDAWHFLITRGCGRISLQVAQAADRQRLCALGPAVRLWG